jgi:hypothetical protein
MSLKDVTDGRTDGRFCLLGIGRNGQILWIFSRICSICSNICLSDGHEPYRTWRTDETDTQTTLGWGGYTHWATLILFGTSQTALNWSILKPLPMQITNFSYHSQIPYEPRPEPIHCNISCYVFNLTILQTFATYRILGSSRSACWEDVLLQCCLPIDLRPYG